MPKRRDTQLDPDKFLSPVAIRVNLVLASLYIAAYEILRLSIVECTKNSVVSRVEGAEYDDLIAADLRQDDESASHFLARRGAIPPSPQARAAYEAELQVPYDERIERGLIPSADWLRKEGVLDEEAIEIIKRLRAHRNEIAHELPSILIGQGFDLNLEYLEHIEAILNHVETWRFHDAYNRDPGMQRFVQDRNLNLEDVTHARGTILQVLISAVEEFLRETERKLTQGQNPGPPIRPTTR